MGALFRVAALGLVLGFVLCMAAYNLSGDMVWRQRAMQLLKWGVVLALGFFGLLILRRGAVFL